MSDPADIPAKIPDCIGHPGLVTLFDYWRSLARDGRLPLRRDFDPLEMRGLLANLYMLDCGGTPDDLRYRLAGDRIVSAFGFEPRGLTRREIRARHVQRGAERDFNETSQQTHDVAARRLVAYTHDHMTSYDRRFMAYVRLNLPISEDGAAATGIIGAIFTSTAGKGEKVWQNFRELHVEKPIVELGLT